jgi:hypothetical protein
VKRSIFQGVGREAGAITARVEPGMKVLSGLGVVAIIVAIVGAVCFLGLYFYNDETNKIQVFPDPRDILKERPPSEIVWFVKN